MPGVKPTTRRDWTERMLRVLVHIQQNLDGPLGLEELARVAGFSPFHFHRIFRGMVGESVRRHVRRLRLERAAARLRTTDQPITSVAFDAGYEAHEAFSRAFRDAFRCSPSEYRAASSEPARIDARAGVHFVPSGGAMVFEPIEVGDRRMDVHVRSIEPMRVVYIRHVGPYDEVGQAWERLCDWAGERCLFGPEMRFVGACYDDPEVTEPSKTRYDACITVDETIPGEGDIGVQTLAGGRYAATQHEGPYDQLGETYAALLGQWFASGQQEPGDPPCLEFYLNDPGDTEPDDLLTEVCMPIHEGPLGPGQRPPDEAPRKGE